MNANTLLADPTAIEIEKFVSLDDAILIVAHSTRKAAICPQCDEPSSSLKCQYLRRLTDLSWHGVAVRLELKARKFRCRNELCSQKVFCERLVNVAAAYARRTIRLMETLSMLAFALGGRAGSRASAKLNIPVGKDLLLRAVRRQTNQTIYPQQSVKVLGVDDFAFRRGISYGTILVDLEQRKPIDLLPDRTAETLKTWLKAHPEIEILTRDRSTVYAEAMRTGAPQSTQVADRWHLLKNLGDLIERFFIQHHDLLTQASAQIRLEYLKRRKDIVFLTDEITEKAIPARRQNLFDSIKELQSQGKPIRAIARELKVARNTVRKYIACETVPRPNSRPGRKSAVLPFAVCLQNLWREGEQNASRLHREIKAQGFSGEVDAVQRFIREWRKMAIGKDFCSISPHGLAPRTVAKLLLKPAAAKTEDERRFLTKLSETSPPIGNLQKLGSGFQKIVKEKRGDLFDDWLTEVKASGIKEIQNWADGLLADEEAVRNALSSEWSNGQTEGQGNRLKTIKRQMYGRANFDLLRARVLHQG